MEETRSSRFKIVGYTYSFSEIDLMLWSPKVDLVAMTTTEGEVVLYRITWEKVWSLPRLEDGVNVSALAWRPDGKVLAVGYTNGCVKLYDIEGGFCSHHHKPLDDKVVLLKWVSELPRGEANEKKGSHIHTEEDIDAKGDDIFLPELPPITNKEVGETNKSTEYFKRLKDQKYFNLLLVGSFRGSCELFAFGIISISRLNLRVENLSLENMLTSADLKTLVLILKDSHQLHFNIYDSANLQANLKLLQQTSMKLGKLETLLAYLDEVLAQMSEVWEDILVEIESKLMKFAESKDNSRSLSFEFLRLLLYGSPSDDLKKFLEYQLTKQAFSKLGRSVQASYRQIQRLLLKNLHTVTHNIIYHLKELLSLSRCIENYKRLGIEEGPVSECLRSAESVLLKGAEMVGVIEKSVKNFNAFYKWLYPTKIKLAGENALLRMSQQEVHCVAQFLKENFDNTKNKLKLEKLGQYLKDEDLSMPVEGGEGVDGSAFFVEGMSESFKRNTKAFFPHSAPTKSLLQLTKALKRNFQAILATCSSAMEPFFFKHLHRRLVDFSSADSSDDGGRFNRLSVSCFDGPYNPPVNKHFFLSSSSSFYSTFLNSSTHLTLFKINIASDSISCVNVLFTHSEYHATQYILDVSFFDDNTLTLLLSDQQASKLFLLDLSTLEDHLKPLFSGASVSDTFMYPLHSISDPFSNSRQCKDLQSLHPTSMCINGQRKIGTVASRSRKSIQLYLVDSDDDDDDNDDDAGDERGTMTSAPTTTSSTIRDCAFVSDDDKENSDVYD